MGGSTKTEEQVSSIVEMGLQKNHSTNDGIDKNTEICIAHIFSQKEGIDYEDTFAPVARYTSIRTIIAFESNMKWKLHQMDVQTTFLNGLIEEEVYFEQPQGFESDDQETMYVNSRWNCMGKRKNPKHGMEELMGS